MSSNEDVHFIEDLEQRENPSVLAPTTMALGEESGDIAFTMACFETGC